MIGGVATETEQAKLRSSGQWSKGYVAGLEMPRIVFQARINQTFTSLDRVGQIEFDTVTLGAYTDIEPEQTLWIGASAGGYEIGMARIRKAAASDTLYIGETSDLPLVDNLYLTVVDEPLPWMKHLHVEDGTFADYEIAYDDQHEVFEPVAVMGADVVAVLEPLEAAIIDERDVAVTWSGTWGDLSNALYYFSTARHSETDGDYAELIFWGALIRVYVAKGQFNGIADIYIDGVLEESVDTWNGSTLYRQMVFERTDLSAGSHTVRVEVTGTKNPSASWHWIELDAFECSLLSVEVTRSAADSWAFDAAITDYAWSAPGAAEVSGETTDTLTARYAEAGAYPLYCTVTADNGKSHRGVRMVYVVENPLACRWKNAGVDMSDGGASFEVELYTDVERAVVRDRGRCILWTEDWYGNVKGSIGFESGNEHVLMGGWVQGESIEVDTNGGAVRFAVKGAHWWMGKMDGFSPVLNFATRTPNAWDQMAGMTVDRGVWHLLHIRSNITSIMDVRLTGDTRLAKKLESSTTNLWEAVSTFGDRIAAVPFVDALGRFFLQVDPLAVPVTERSEWPIIMELTSADLEDGWDIRRETAQSLSQVDISGRACDTSGREKTYYALAPGHIPSRTGSGSQSDKFAVTGQAQVNQLAGLLHAWQNNEYPDIELRLPSNFRVVSLAPYQFIHLAVGADENPRGVELTMNLVPRGLRFNYDEDAGCIETVLECEAETGESNSCNGDIPGVDEDLSEPPTPKLPDDPILPPGTDVTARPKKVLIKDRERGLLYTENGDAEDPLDIQWEFVNGGLSDDLYKGEAMTHILVTNYGRVYLGYLDPFSGITDEVWVADSVGGIFRKIIDNNWLRDTLGKDSSYDVSLSALGMNTLADDQIAMAAMWSEIGFPLTDEGYILVGNSAGFTARDHLIDAARTYGSISFGGGKWVLTGSARTVGWTPALWTLNGSGSPSAELLTAGAAEPTLHVRAGSSDKLFVFHREVFEYVTGNGATHEETGHSGIWFATNEWNMACDPTAQYLMASTHPGGALPYKSSDYGYTWSALTAVLPIGTKAFCWGKYDTARFAAAGGAVYFTSDFGTTWEDMSGNLAYVCPLPNIDFIKVIE